MAKKNTTVSSPAPVSATIPEVTVITENTSQEHRMNYPARREISSEAREIFDNIYTMANTIRVRMGNDCLNDVERAILVEGRESEKQILLDMMNMHVRDIFTMVNEYFDKYIVKGAILKCDAPTNMKEQHTKLFKTALTGLRQLAMEGWKADRDSGGLAGEDFKFLTTTMYSKTKETHDGLYTQVGLERKAAQENKRRNIGSALSANLEQRQRFFHDNNNR